MVIFTNVKPEELKQRLKSLDYSTDNIKTIHEEGRWKKTVGKEVVTLTLYTSGKLLLQGEKEAVKEIAEELEKLNLGEKEKTARFKSESGWIIGSDESLKGDTFGGIVVAAVKADEKIRQLLAEMGVKDSKKLSDREILVLAESIRKVAPCEVKSLLPEEYNQYHQQGTKVTSLLNQLHQKCAQGLSPGKHIVDEYPGCSVGDFREPQAESKYLEVAAASVLARAAALQQLNYLSKLAGFSLPKGSTHVRPGLIELKKRNLDLWKFVKMDFANVKEFGRDNY